VVVGFEGNIIITNNASQPKTGSNRKNMKYGEIPPSRSLRDIIDKFGTTRTAKTRKKMTETTKEGIG
jgi:hypothetical protein